MLKYEFRKIDMNTASQLIELSKAWSDEDSCWGIVANTFADFCEPLAVALEGENIVGYIFGRYYEQERQTSYMDKGKCCFSVEELYVHPHYRGQGVGRTLFRMMERKVRTECSYITLTTPAKDCKSVLRFYLDELEMDFISAFLIKNVEELKCES